MTDRHLGGICTLAPDGVSDLRWLGSIGHVSGVTYGSTMPGGDDQFSCLLQLARLQREPAIAPGRFLQVWRGGGVVYEGRLDRPAPDGSGHGWQVTAHGSGSYGDDYRAIWTSYTASNILSAAIGRGMRWNVGSVGGGNVSQVSDSASQTVTEFMTAYTNTVSLTWFVDQPGWPGGQTVNVFPVPTAVTRLLVTTIPAAPDLVDYINDLYVQYQTSPDGSAKPATSGLTHSTLASSITAHGRTEDYWDLSSSGQMSTGTAQGNASSALAKYVSASFSQAFTARSGQYLTVTGQPVDLACERAGEVARLVLAAGGFGGEINVMWPITFPVGSVAWDDEGGLLTVTPYQMVDTSFSGLLGLLAPPPPKPKPAPKKLTARQREARQDRRQAAARRH